MTRGTGPRVVPDAGDVKPDLHHVYPLDDAFAHDDSREGARQCPCCPVLIPAQTMEGRETFIVRHRRMDGGEDSHES